MRWLLCIMAVVAGGVCGLQSLYAQPHIDWEAKSAPFKPLYQRPKHIPFPKNNPYSQLVYELGEQLFFDVRLSSDGQMSCASCHDPKQHWTDGLPRSRGHDNQELLRKTPSLYNLAWDRFITWDGRQADLEGQSIQPLLANDEMALSHQELIAILKNDISYRDLFYRAFPNDSEPITAVNIAKALATFQRMIISPITAFDRWIDGDLHALTPQQKQGFVLFNDKANCSACHIGWRMSSDIFNDIGLPDPDIGRGRYDPDPAMQHAFKTVGLRKIAQRPPYTHNGQFATLEDVIEHYDQGEVVRELTQPVTESEEVALHQFSQPLNLTDQEKKALREFLKVL